MYQFTPVVFKIINALLNIGSFMFYTFAVENGMNSSCGIFLSIALVHALRGIESTMNKSMPVNELEPALSLALYSAMAFGLSYINLWFAFSIFVVYPFFTFSGLFPQAIVFIQWIVELVCSISGIFFVPPISFIAGLA